MRRFREKRKVKSEEGKVQKEKAAYATFLSGDPYEIQTLVAAVKSRYFNRFFSLFSLISSLEKSRGKIQRKEKSEK